MSRPKGGRSIQLRGTALASERVVAPSLFRAILKWGIYRVVVLRNNVKGHVCAYASARKRDRVSTRTHTSAYYMRACKHKCASNNTGNSPLQYRSVEKLRCINGLGAEKPCTDTTITLSDYCGPKQGQVNMN